MGKELQDSRVVINLKLYGIIKDIAAEEIKDDSIITIPSNSTINYLIQILGIPEYRIGLIVVNECVAKVNRVLSNNDIVKIFPPIGGG